MDTLETGHSAGCFFNYQFQVDLYTQHGRIRSTSPLNA